MTRLLRFMSLACGLTLLITPGTHAAPPEAVTAPFAVEHFTLETGADGTTRIVAEGFASAGAPGNPVLPTKVLALPVHPDIDWRTTRVALKDGIWKTLPGRYTLPAAPPAVARYINDDGEPVEVTAWGDARRVADGRNLDVWERDADFPGWSVLELPYSQDRAQKLARVQLCPVQYNPVQKSLTLLESGTIELRYRLLGPARAADRHPSTAASQAPAASSQSYDFCIITTQYIVSTSATLADYVAHRESQGFSVLVKTIESIETDYTQALRPELFESTDERADRIRAFLKDTYLASGLEYVLLIGHPDPDDPTNGADSVGDVPMKYAFPDGYHAPTDAYYMDMTGNWDVDGDTLYGEWEDDWHNKPGGVDFANLELHVARIPQYDTNLASLDAILQKLISYDNEFLGGTEAWRTSCFMPNPIDYSDAYGSEGNISPITMAEWIRNTVLIPSGWSYYRIYEHAYTHPPYDITPPPEQIPLGLGHTNFTHYSSTHYFKAGFNVSSSDITNYTITSLTDDNDATAWSGTAVTSGQFLQFKTANPDDDGRRYIPDKIVIKGASLADLPDAFTIRMAANATMSDAYTVVTETSGHAHAALEGGYYVLKYEDADGTLNKVGRKRYIRLTFTHGGSTDVQINELTAYSEENASIKPYVLPEWQNGYGVAYYNTHGSATSAGDVISSSECPLLDDDKPCFTFQKACSNAYPEASNNLAYALLAHGGIASLGAARVSYGLGDSGYPAWMPRMIQQNKPFGVVRTEMLEEFAATGALGWGGLFADAMRFNVYGDPATAILSDKDGDTMPYWFEQRHGLDPDNAADRDLDPDNDTYTNVEEWVADTDPTDPASKPAITTETLYTGGAEPGMHLTFPTSKFRWYKVYYGDGPYPATWQPCSGDIQGTGGDVVFVDNGGPGRLSPTDPSCTRRSYRVEVRLGN